MRRQQVHYQHIKMSGLTRAQEMEIMEILMSLQEGQKSINQKLDAMNKKMDEDIAENRKSIEKLRREREQREQASQKLSLIHI